MFVRLRLTNEATRQRTRHESGNIGHSLHFKDSLNQVKSRTILLKFQSPLLHCRPHGIGQRTSHRDHIHGDTIFNAPKLWPGFSDRVTAALAPKQATAYCTGLSTVFDARKSYWLPHYLEAPT